MLGATEAVLLVLLLLLAGAAVGVLALLLRRDLGHVPVRGRRDRTWPLPTPESVRPVRRRSGATDRGYAPYFDGGGSYSYGGDSYGGGDSGGGCDGGGGGGGGD